MLLLVHITARGIIYVITYVKILHVFITLKKKISSDCNLFSSACTKFANKVVWVAKKNDWILSLSYKLQRSRLLFHKLEICSFSKNITSIGPLSGQ